MKRVIIEKKNKAWGFEAYNQVNTKAVHPGPAITIYNTGSFILSAAFLRVTRTELDNVNFVKFFYDKNSHTIGIKFTNDKCEIGISKITSKKYPNRSFSGMRFLNHYSLNIKKIAGRYKPTREFINEKIGHLWIISLKDNEEKKK